ncbi:uncharacterized protein LOC117282628 [Cryptotermes secundus]|uniref:uncharacterized protein LOC117282628 n=1 Tax=Cryptotermes secundus TaxID=105785 RepID=UPI001454CF1C|nr:uncharacterized protein LOC117282628 [Cryptotermes secundus]
MPVWEGSRKHLAQCQDVVNENRDVDTGHFPLSSHVCMIMTIVMSSSVYGVPRHSPLLLRFNVIIGRIVEAGLQMKWNSDSLHQALLNGSIFAVSSFQTADPAPLSLTHLQTAFYLLISGLLCSTVVFILQLKCSTSTET